MGKRKSENDNLAKVALDCADKMRRVDAVIPPPIPTETKFSHNFSFTFFDKDSVPWWDEPLMMVAAIGMATGFICIGFAIASGMRW